MRNDLTLIGAFPHVRGYLFLLILNATCSKYASMRGKYPQLFVSSLVKNGGLWLLSYAQYERSQVISHGVLN
jgi:hypothetical protein